MVLSTVVEAKRTSSGIRATGFDFVAAWLSPFETTQAPHSKSMSSRPGAVAVEVSLSSLSCLTVVRSFFGMMARALVCCVSASIVPKSLTNEKLSHGLLSIVKLSKSPYSVEYPVELGTADMAIPISAFSAWSTRYAFFLRSSPVSRVCLRMISSFSESSSLM